MKTNKDFRLSKQTKRMLALSRFRDNNDRHAFKRAMIDAQVTAEKASKDNQRGNNNGE